MSIKNRLARVEKQLPPPRETVLDYDEEDCLRIFGDEAASYAEEPDFPRALATLRDAIAEAKRSVDPPWVPPDHFEADHVYRGVRLERWRHSRFPAVSAALEWLHELNARIFSAVPPCSEAEWEELRAWFEANAARIDRAADELRPHQLIDVGVMGTYGHRVRVRGWTVRFDLGYGPRGEGSGRVAEVIRRLRKMFPAEGEAGGP